MLNGVLNVNKPKGWTSYDVIRHLKSIIGGSKLGHAGTLDPAAVGVLPVAIGKATKLIEFAYQLKKRYRGKVCLGYVSDTDDSDGTLLPGKDSNGLTEEQVNAALKMFEGEIEQIPPKFSAVRIGGTKAYELARKGVDVQLRPRKVKIFAARLLSFQAGWPAYAEIEVECASGAYMRSIARDLGNMLGVGGYLAELVRVAYGQLTVDKSVDPRSLNSIKDIKMYLLPPSVLVEGMPKLQLSQMQISVVTHGRKVKVDFPKSARVAAINPLGELVCIGKVDSEGTFYPDKLLVP
jgi:tRNA pseudouridine55 synthase